MINQKIIRHTENFWGSGSYSKTVRPNGFLIYRQGWGGVHLHTMHAHSLRYLHGALASHIQT